MGWNRNRLSIVFLLIFTYLSVIAQPCTVWAQEAQPPHLIQTVTDEDIYEGLLALGLLECPVLEAEDCRAAYEKVKDCVVRLDMGNAYGSGVIWEMAPEQIVIVTNKHVLDYWDNLEGVVCFPQGARVSAEILGVSEEYDVGFLAADCMKLGYGQVGQMRYVRWDMETYQQMQPGSDIFVVGAGDGKEAEDMAVFYPGSIGAMWQYIEAFDEYMIYSYGNAVPGMSGGGTFDAKGNFIGMISGGTKAGETASVPLPVIIEAYETVR